MPDILSLAGLMLAMDGSSLKGMLAVVLGVGALIFVHELGHFLAAKFFGVKVFTFSLGFGHRLFGFRRGDTDYRVSLLPLGGYVRMLGQADDDPNEASTDDPADFRNKAPGQRFVILVAGVVMNIVFAAFAFVLAFGLGVEFTASEVGAIEPGSPAARADLRVGDVITAVDGEEVLGFQDLQTIVALSSGERELTVRRDGRTLTTTVKPLRGDNENYARIGVQPAIVIGGVAPDSPLKGKVLEATPERSDRLLNVSPVDSRAPPATRMSAAELDRAIEQARGPVAVTVERSTYDARGVRTSSELKTFEVDVPQRPQLSLGIALPDHAWIRRVTPDSPAARAGVQAGDRIVALGPFDRVGRSNLPEVIREVGATIGDRPVPIVVERPTADRGMERLQLEVSLEPQNRAMVEAALEGVEGEAARVDMRRAVGQWFLGVDYRADIVGERVALPLADAEAEPVFLEPGDRLVAAWTHGAWGFWRSEEPIAGPRELDALLRRMQKRPLKLQWIPRGTTEKRAAVVQARELPSTYGDLGIARMAREVAVQRGPLDAVLLGLHETVTMTQRIFLMVRSFVTGAVSPGELGGPMQIVTVTYVIAREDSLGKLLHLLAILSVNLAVINILPIPVLDGGHIFFLAIEKLKGRPVSSDVMAYANYVGLFMILGLIALVFFNDIRRLVLG